MPKRIMPPGSSEASKTRDGVAEQREVVCGGEAGGTRADDRDLSRAPLPPAGARRRRAGGPADARRSGCPRRPASVAGRPACPGRTDSTPYFSVTKRFRARIAIGASMAPRRQASSQGAAQTRPQTEANGIGRARDQEGLLVAALGDQLDVAAGVRRDGTARLALDLGLPVREIGQTGCDRHRQSRRTELVRGARGGREPHLAPPGIDSGRRACERPSAAPVAGPSGHGRDRDAEETRDLGAREELGLGRR